MVSHSWLEYDDDDDYIEIRHDDGVFAGMRAVPITSGFETVISRLMRARVLCSVLDTCIGR